MTATMLQTLPWSPQRAGFIKINSEKSIVGKKFTVTINGKMNTGIFEDQKPFWRSATGVGLDLYVIDADNTINVDATGDCPNIESITLKIDGANVVITPKA